MRFLVFIIGSVAWAQSVSPFAPPSYASDPATCTVPSIYYNSVINNIKICEASNTWISVTPNPFIIDGGSGQAFIETRSLDSQISGFGWLGSTGVLKFSAFKNASNIWQLSDVTNGKVILQITPGSSICPTGTCAEMPNGEKIGTGTASVYPWYFNVSGPVPPNSAVWSNTTTYAINTMAKYPSPSSAGLPYISLTNGNVGNQPDISPGSWKLAAPIGSILTSPDLVSIVQGSLGAEVATTNPLVVIANYADGALPARNMSEVNIISSRKNGAAAPLMALGWPQTGGYAAQALQGEVIMDKSANSGQASGGFPLYLQCWLLNIYDSCTSEIDVLNISGVDTSLNGDYLTGQSRSGGVRFAGLGYKNSFAISIGAAGSGSFLGTFKQGISFSPNATSLYAITLPNGPAGGLYARKASDIGDGNSTMLPLIYADSSNNVNIGGSGVGFTYLQDTINIPNLTALDCIATDSSKTLVSSNGNCITTGFPQSRAWQTSGQSIPSGTNTDLTFDTNSSFEQGSMHSTSVNPSRFTVGTGQAGLYCYTAQVFWPAAGSPGNERDIIVYANGISGTVLSKNKIPASGTGTFVTNLQNVSNTQQVSDCQHLNDGDYVDAAVVQDSGGSLTTVGAGQFTTYFVIYRAH